MALPTKLSWDTFHNVINGALRNSQTTHRSYDPWTREELWPVPVATKDDIEDAVKAAQKAFESWRSTAFNERKERLLHFRKIWTENGDDMNKLLSKETGKPLAEARWEIDACTALLDWYLTLDELEERCDDASKTIITRYAPLGVVAAICPWNYPLSLAFYKIAPSILAGNAVIVKPSPFAPYTTLKTVELGQQAFPAGIFQAMVGDKSLGPSLTTHPGIAKIAFTGSIAAGKKIMAECAGSLKRVTLELGGNDAAIVLPDVDIEKAVPELVWSVFLTAGQICLATKRIYIHQDIYDEFLKAMVKCISKIKEGVDMGPVQNAMQYDKVKEIFADSKTRGFKFALGPEEPPQGKGYYIEPTVIDNPPSGSRIIEEEPFGPIVPCQPWTDEDEVVRRANDTTMGLGATVWGRDVERARRIGWRLDAGTIAINGPARPDPRTPVGGHKESGIGAEGGKHGLLAYLNPHVMIVCK